MGNQVQWLRGDHTSTSLHFFKLVSFSLRLIMECTGYEFLLSICRSSEFIEGNKAICFLIYTLYNMWQTYLVVYIKYCIIIIFLLFYMCDQSNLFNYCSSNSSFAQLDMHYNIYCFYSLHDITVLGRHYIPYALRQLWTYPLPMLQISTKKIRKYTFCFRLNGCIGVNVFSCICSSFSGINVN